MAKPRLETLTLTKFRGSCQSTSFEFDTSKEIILIFGENGTGKSSIADAIDFLCNNEFGSLLHRKGTKPAAHIVAYEALAKELAVSLHFGGQEWRAALRGPKPITTPAQPPRAFVLRRADITKVMESIPADRYKALQAYITVPNVEAAEGELRDAHRDAQKALERAVADRSNADDALEQFWKAEGSPGANAIEWAKSKTSEESNTMKNALDANNQLLQCFDKTQTEYAQWQEAQTGVQGAENALADANRALQSTVATLTAQSDLLVSVLDGALSYFQANAATNQRCPVCGKPEARATLLHHVQNELEQLTQVRELAHLRDLRQTALTQAKGVLTNAQRLVVQQCQELAPRLAVAPQTLAKNVDARALSEVSHDPASLVAIGNVLAQLTNNRPIFEQELEEVRKTLYQRTAIKSHLQTIATITQDLTAKQALANRLAAMLEIVEAQRKAYVANLINSISHEVNNLYTRIHPAESLGRPTFSVKPNTAGSLELKADFGNATDVVPGAYYSEAHLDTLGLCVYLALAKYSGVGNSLVVLDDVLTSVDEVHLERIIDLLNEEAPNFGHLLITTHSRAWFDRLRMAKGMNADLFELYGWDLANGIRHSRSPLHVEELRQTLHAAKLDRQAAASKAGILLEQLLDDLALRYECRVRHRRDSAYTLGELADAINGSKAIKSLRVVQTRPDGSECDSALKPLLDICTSYTWVRNQVGAHFNLGAAGIVDASVRSFAQSVLDLADTLICPCCHQLPNKDKTGQYWQCGSGCGKTQLYPLRAPAN